MVSLKDNINNHEDLMGNQLKVRRLVLIELDKAIRELNIRIVAKTWNTRDGDNVVGISDIEEIIKEVLGSVDNNGRVEK